MILVVGSTGSLGSAVVKGLTAAGKTVKALVRDASSDRAKELRSAGATLVVGDLKSPATIAAALKGIETVICTASSTLSRREGDSIETVDLKGVRDLIEAAESAKVRRFVFVSFSSNLGDDFPLAIAKRAAEKLLESSGMEYTILRPSCFPETWFSPAVGFDTASGKVRIYGNGMSKVSYVALDDVARATLACVDNSKVGRMGIQIGGPRAISQLDAVGLAEKAIAKKMQLEFMTLDQIAAARKEAKDSLTESFLGLFDGIARGDEIPTRWTETLGVRPRSMEEWFATAR